jgi:hypothetical protein
MLRAQLQAYDYVSVRSFYDEFTNFMPSDIK